MSSKPVVVKLNLDKSGFSAGVTSAQRQMKQLQASAQQMGHGTVSSMQSASAAIRLLEGGISNNIRAAERFIGLLGPISGMLQSAFPLVGGLALAGVFVKIGVEAANFIKKMNEIPPNPFESMIASGKVANDQLLITNDRLQIEIARLEHKPVNGIAYALDTARDASDKLFESLLKTNAAFNEAMGKDNIGFFKGLWNNMQPTDAANKDIASARSGVQSVRADHESTINDALAGGNMANVDQAREAMMVDLQRAYQQQDKQLRAGLDAALAKQKDFQGAFHVGSDQSKVIEKYQGALAQSANEQTSIGADYGRPLLERQKQDLEDQKANAEAAKAAQEAIIQQWRRNLDDQKGYFTDELTQEARFWVQRMEESKKGSLSYITALDEANKGIARMHMANLRSGEEFEKISRISPDSMDLSRGDNGEMAAGGRDSAAKLKSMNEGIAMRRADADAMARSSLQMEVMTGRMTQLDAATKEATMHEQDYLKTRNDINDAIAKTNSLPEGEFKRQQLSDLSNQRDHLDAVRRIQSSQDQQNISALQVGPAIRQGVDQMVQGFLEMTTTLKSVIPRAVDSLNDNLVKAMTGHGSKGDFGRTFSEAGSGLLKTGLQGLEGKALAMFGLGPKGAPGSSPVNPIYAIVLSGMGSAASSIGGAASGVLSGALGKLGGFGSFIQPFIGALPHFAEGGNVLPNYPSIFGERGPEMWIPRGPGTVIPNNQLSGMGGNHIHLNVDARGSSDPSAIDAAVRRSAPHIAAAAMQGTHNMSRRRPAGR